MVKCLAWHVDGRRFKVQYTNIYMHAHTHPRLVISDSTYSDFFQFVVLGPLTKLTFVISMPESEFSLSVTNFFVSFLTFLFYLWFLSFL